MNKLSNFFIATFIIIIAVIPNKLFALDCTDGGNILLYECSINTSIFNGTLDTTTYSEYTSDTPNPCCVLNCVSNASLNTSNICKCDGGFGGTSLCTSCLSGTYSPAANNDCSNCPTSHTSSPAGSDSMNDCYTTCTAITSGNAVWTPTAATENYPDQCSYNMSCSAGIPDICIDGTCDLTDIEYNSAVTCETSEDCANLTEAGIYTIGTATYTGVYGSGGSWNVSACSINCADETATGGNGHWVPNANTATAPNTCEYTNNNLICDSDYTPSDTTPIYSTTKCINELICTDTTIQDSIEISNPGEPATGGNATWDGTAWDLTTCERTCDQQFPTETDIAGTAIYDTSNWNYATCTATAIYSPLNGEDDSGTKTCFYNSANALFENACTNFNVTNCDGGYYWENDFTTNPEDCDEVGQGYYSTDDDINRNPCDYGSTTWKIDLNSDMPITNASSATECIILGDSHINKSTFCNDGNATTCFELPVHVHYYGY